MPPKRKRAAAAAGKTDVRSFFSKGNANKAAKVPKKETGAIDERNRRGKAAGVAAVNSAKRRGVAIINNGAGTMPLNAPAPFGGERYTLLVATGGKTTQSQAAAHDGSKDAEGKLHFEGYDTFRPLFTPSEAIRAGIFGGLAFTLTLFCLQLLPQVAATLTRRVANLAFSVETLISIIKSFLLIGFKMWMSHTTYLAATTSPQTSIG